MMEDFKKMIEEDIKEVFLDLEMFGEKHLVAGKECTIILDDMEKLRRNELYQDDKAVHKKQLFFYIAAEDLKKPPEIGRIIDIDGRDYAVTHMEVEDGIYAVTAEEYRA